MPALAFVERLQSEVLAAREDSDPVLFGQAYNVRRYRDRLYCLKSAAPDSVQETLWPSGQTTIKVSDRQSLSCIPSSAGISREQWQNARIKVTARSGGEKISLPGRTGHHALKKLFQEAGIPPWQREAIPLVYLDEKLAAVGDLWISAEFYSDENQDCVSLILQRED